METYVSVLKEGTYYLQIAMSLLFEHSKNYLSRKVKRNSNLRRRKYQRTALPMLPSVGTWRGNSVRPWNI
jgi:hypothetical protein